MNGTLSIYLSVAAVAIKEPPTGCLTGFKLCYVRVALLFFFLGISFCGFAKKKKNHDTERREVRQ